VSLTRLVGTMHNNMQGMRFESWTPKKKWNIYYCKSEVYESCFKCWFYI